MRRAEAYAIVAEYYEAVEVVVREDETEFRAKYFGPGAGIWLARDGAGVRGEREQVARGGKSDREGNWPLRQTLRVAAPVGRGAGRPGGLRRHR